MDTNGVTNVIGGLVERNGMLWIEDLPIGAGTNSLTLRAIDAAGNLSTTSLSIVKSAVTLTIDSTPEGEGLYDPYGTVSGTVSDATAGVTVNGVAATVDGSGNWTADGVPIYGRGTATFDAFATPSGGGTLTTASVEKEMPAIVRIVKHLVLWNGEVEDDVIGEFSLTSSESWTKDYKASEVQAPNGQWQVRYNGEATSFFQSGVSWNQSDYSWSDTNEGGTFRYQDSGGWDETESPVPGQKSWRISVPDASFDHYSAGNPRYIYNVYAKGVRHSWDDGNIREDSRMSAKTRMRLYTGGKAGVQQSYLIRLTASTHHEYAKPVAYPWEYTPTFNIAASRIRLLGKPIGDDYNQWSVQPGNAQMNLNQRVEGSPHYDLSAAAANYRLIINRHGLQANRRTNNVIVGEKIELTAQLISPVGEPAPPVTNYQWTVPGYAISNYLADANAGNVHAAFTTTTNSVSYYWVDGGNRTVVCAVQAMGMLLMTGTHFDVFRPSAELSIIATGTIGADTDYYYATPTLPYLHLGDPAGVAGVEFIYTNATLGSYTNAWQFFFVQLIDRAELKQCVGSTETHCKGYTNGLDGSIPYLNTPFPNLLSGTLSDSPGMELHNDATTASLVEDFTLYLMFEPGYPVTDSVPVPIKVAGWGWGGEAVQTNGVWTLSGSAPPTSTSGVDTTVFPTWIYNIAYATWHTNSSACACP